jgi:hypothetical protein
MSSIFILQLHENRDSIQMILPKHLLVNFKYKLELNYHLMAMIMIKMIRNKGKLYIIQKNDIISN